jgi:hypothetical protein
MMSPHNWKLEEARRDKEFIDESIDRFVTTLRRAEHLAKFAETAFPQGRYSETKDDILRAAVVLLHATLEDFLRYLGTKFISSSNDKDVLNKISLLGSRGRTEKFSLGELAAHRDKTVKQLIAESVEAHFNKRSFSNTDQISQVLESVGVPIGEVGNFYPCLGELMAKRHDIVHEGDLKPSNKPGERDTKPIDPNKIKEWSETLTNFLNAVQASKLKTGV